MPIVVMNGFASQRDPVTNAFVDYGSATLTFNVGYYSEGFSFSPNYAPRYGEGWQWGEIVSTGHYARPIAQSDIDPGAILEVQYARLFQLIGPSTQTSILQVGAYPSAGHRAGPFEFWFELSGDPVLAGFTEATLPEVADPDWRFSHFPVPYSRRFVDLPNTLIGSGIPGVLLRGTQGEDTLTGGIGDDTVLGSDGNDALWGFMDDDLLLGGSNFDTIYAGAGNDTAEGGAGRDLAFLGAGNDLFADIAQSGELGQDTVFAGTGSDTIVGRGGHDLFYGGGGQDLIFGREGNDYFFGGDGDDELHGADGADNLFGGSGNDELQGGSGNDVIFGGAGDDLVFLNRGNDRYFSVYGKKTAPGTDTVFGGHGNDTISASADTSNVIHGEWGDDLLLGGGRNDSIFGGDGADSLWGGTGMDQLTGGNGLDTFFFVDGFGADTVFGFDAADGEKISFAGVTNITDFADLVTNHLVNAGGTAQIVDGANSILLNGVAFVEVGVGFDYSAGDFIF